MELNQQQISTATTLKGSGLFPSQIADKIGVPRGVVRKFFKEKRRATMMQGASPASKAEPIKDRNGEIRALSGDGSNYTFEGVKHAQAQGVKFGDIAEAWGYTMQEMRQWMAGEGGKRYTAGKHAPQPVTVVAAAPETKKSYTEEDKAAAKAMMASGVEWHKVAEHFNLPLRTVNMWRTHVVRAAKRSGKPIIQPVTPAPAFASDAATAPVFAIPEPVVALPQTAPLPTITNHAAVALAWTGYAAWMTRDGVKPLMFTEADVDMLMKVYDAIVAGK